MNNRLAIRPPKQTTYYRMFAGGCQWTYSILLWSGLSMLLGKNSQKKCLKSWTECTEAVCGSQHWKGRGDDSCWHACRAARFKSHGKYMDIVWLSEWSLLRLVGKETMKQTDFGLLLWLKMRAAVLLSFCSPENLVCHNADGTMRWVLLTQPDTIGPSDWLDKWAPITLIIFLPHFLLFYGCSMVQSAD